MNNGWAKLLGNVYFFLQCSKHLPMGENKNREEIQTPASLLVVPVLQKEATRPGKTILKVNTQRTCTLHALLPFFQPLGNRNPMFLCIRKAGNVSEGQNTLLPDALFSF